MMWLGNIMYTDSTGGSNLYMKQRQNNVTWTKYQSKMIQNAIITHCHMHKQAHTKLANYAYRLTGNTPPES